eukprot:NODE_12065_length_242_cov_11.813472_g10295_i0.p5 GENE.NODE_12065_length_242_cov_11.813472_g10295_i0~~NODE_12065_length_242_cov_11.813472_g10295_i0.p5  ORF type:complete len:68 (-),score=13.37 NODE_12065_length_242_cov_11.813472_g10295_i0:39-218(-)
MGAVFSLFSHASDHTVPWPSPVDANTRSVVCSASPPPRFVPSPPQQDLGWRLSALYAAV